MLILACASVAGLILLSIGLAIVEHRREAPLSFRCARCGAEFQQPAHRGFPRACPACGAEDWAAG